MLAVRRMARSDAPFVRSLGALAFGEYDPDAGEHTLHLSQRAGTAAFVATLDARPVGVAIVSFLDGSPALDAIAVEAESRGRGVGRRLLRAAEAEVRRRGAHLLQLVTAEANLAALDLFTKAGYAIVARRARYYRRGQNALVLRKRLE